MCRQTAIHIDPGSTEREIAFRATGTRVVPRDARRSASTLLATRSVMLAVVAATPLALWPAPTRSLTPIEALGKNVFFDTNLSRPRGKQACASCHDAARGGVFPNAAVNLGPVAAPGAVPGARGSFKTPTNAYALGPQFQSAPSPFLAPWIGGVFWDGRAEGCGKSGGSCPIVSGGDASATLRLSDLPASKQGAFGKYIGHTADQALNPFPNPVEQNIPVDQVCREVEFARYRLLYPLTYGEQINCSDIPPVVGNDPPYLASFKRIVVAIAAYQASSEVNSFSSKRDLALKRERDGQFPLNGLTPSENLGHDLFYSPKGNCFSCHEGVPDGQTGQPTDGTAAQELYTDSRFHNLGVPFNRQIPSVAARTKEGLEAHVPGVGRGVFKTPTLRNVAKGLDRGFVKAFAHNGWFKSLESIVHFYNTRDTLVRCEALGITAATEAEARRNNCWPKPEFGENRNSPLSLTDFSLRPPGPPAIPGDVNPAPTFGNLGLTNIGPFSEEAAIVAYLKTLSDLVTSRKPIGIGLR